MEQKKKKMPNQQLQQVSAPSEVYIDFIIIIITTQYDIIRVILTADLQKGSTFLLQIQVRGWSSAVIMMIYCTQMKPERVNEATLTLLSQHV